MGNRGERCQHSRFLKIIGGMAVVALAVGVISQLDDIRRYIKISTM